MNILYMQVSAFFNNFSFLLKTFFKVCHSKTCAFGFKAEGRGVCVCVYVRICIHACTCVLVYMRIYVDVCACVVRKRLRLDCEEME